MKHIIGGVVGGRAVRSGRWVVIAILEKIREEIMMDINGGPKLPNNDNMALLRQHARIS